MGHDMHEEGGEGLHLANNSDWTHQLRHGWMDILTLVNISMTWGNSTT